MAVVSGNRGYLGTYGRIQGQAQLVVTLEIGEAKEYLAQPKGSITAADGDSVEAGDPSPKAIRTARHSGAWKREIPVRYLGI